MEICMSQLKLLQPVNLAGLKLSNRIVMAPLTRSRSDDHGVPPRYAADYYGQRADAGLIITEATNISVQARGYALTPGIWSPAQVASWHRVTQAVHGRGGKIFLQLWHTGRLSHPDLHDGELPVAPSAIAPEGQAFTNDGMKDFVTPRALETDEIPAIVQDYRHAALCARQAGFDGVEIHSANNYLLDQFLRDSTNKRTDRYGGSVANRIRFPMEVVEAVKQVWDAKRVGIRISPVTNMPGNAKPDSNVMATYGAYYDALSAAGLLYIHGVEGVTQLTREAPEGVDFTALRRRFSGFYIANNRYSKDLAEAAIARGEADLISFGRPFLANPDFVERLRIGAPLAEAPEDYWYGGDATGYADWPGMNGQISVAA
jgi:N-ethylmaleimide reductase